MSKKQTAVRAVLVRIVLLIALIGTGLFDNQARAQTETSTRDYTFSTQEILNTWQRRRDLKELSGDAVGEQLLFEIHKKKILFGYESLPELSISLIREARALEASKKIDDAKKLLTYAVALSPTMVEPHKELLRYHLTGKIFSISGLIKHTMSTFKLSLANRTELFRHIFNIVVFFLSLSALFIVSITLVHGIKSIPLVVYDLQAKIIAHAPKYVVLLIVAFLLIASLTLFKIPGLIGLAILLTWKYSAKPMRVGLVVSTIVFITTGFGLINLTPQLEFMHSNQAQIAQISNGLMRNTKATRILNYQNANPSDPIALFAKSLLEIQAGRPNEATLVLEQILAQNSGFEKAYINLANLYFTSGQATKAIEQYKALLQINSNNFLGNYNLGKIYYHEAFLEEGNATLRKAKDLAPKRYEYLEKLYSQFNLDGAYLFNANLGWNDIKRTAKQSSQAAILPTQLNYALFFSVVFLTILIICHFALRGRKMTASCEKCGDISQMDKSWDKVRKHQTECFRDCVNRITIDPELKIQKERQIRLYQSRRILVARIAAFIFPGSGHFYLGFAKAGTFFTLGVALIFALFLPLPYAVTPYQLPTFATLSTFAVILAAILFYFFSIYDLIKRQ